MSEPQSIDSAPSQGNLPAAVASPITMPYYFGAPWLPTYSGNARTPGTSTLREFKEKMQSMFRLYPLSDAQKVEILMGQLKGPALREARAWSAEERGTVEAIFKKLMGIFDSRTISDLKGRLYARKQNPQESLREFALGLQEAMKAVQALDPREVQQADETLINLFVEGARGESIRAQLRMWKRQQPQCTFAEFKETMLQILGLNQSDDGECDTSDRVEDESFFDNQQLLRPDVVVPRGTVAQQSQVQKEPDPIGALNSKLTELTLNLTRMGQKLEELSQGQMGAKRTEWRQDRGGRNWSRWDTPRELGRRTTDQFDSQGRPICRACRQSGHIERNCTSGALNEETPRRGTNPRE